MACRTAVGCALDLDLDADVGQGAFVRLGAGIAVQQAADDALFETQLLIPSLVCFVDPLLRGSWYALSSTAAC